MKNNKSIAYIFEWTCYFNELKLKYFGERV